MIGVCLTLSKWCSFNSNAMDGRVGGVRSVGVADGDGDLARRFWRSFTAACTE